MMLENLFIYFISNIFMSYALLKSYSYISENKIELNLYKSISITIMCILVSINNYYMLALFKILIATLLTFIMIKIVFKDTIKKTIFRVIMITIISAFVDLVLSAILLISFSNISVINNNGLIKISFSLVEAICLINIFKNKYMKKFIDKIENIIIIFSNFYTLSIMTIFILIFAIYIRGENLQSFSLLILIILSLLLLITCIRTIVNDKYNNKILIERNRNLKDSYKAYSETIDECRELKHNLKNDLYSLKTLLPKEHQEQINNIIVKYNSKYEWINRIDDIPEGIQGLIYLKSNEAKQNRIKIFINTNKKIDTNKEDYIDLCDILGILLDNAIEASKKTKKKIIEININESNNYLKITIINQFVNSVDVNKIGKKNYSTKEYKSGIGLNYVKNIKNTHIKVHFKIVNNLFITKIEYKQNKKLYIK